MEQCRYVKRASSAATRSATGHLNHKYPWMSVKIEKVYAVSVVGTTEMTYGSIQGLSEKAEPHLNGIVRMECFSSAKKKFPS
jgi:hypothetical protein